MMESDRRGSNRRTAAVLNVVFGGVGALVVGLLGAVLGRSWVAACIGVVLGAAGAGAVIVWSDRLVLRVSRAHPLDQAEHPHYANLVEGLCTTWGVAPPELYVIEDRNPNGFVSCHRSGRSSLAMTTGLLRKLERIELEGVLSQAIGQIRLGDAELATTTATTVAFPMLASDVLLRQNWLSSHRKLGRHEQPGPGIIAAFPALFLLPLTPLSAWLTRRIVGEHRPTVADQSAVRATRYPPGLARALEKLASEEHTVRSASRATAHMWLLNPLSSDPEERLDRLNEAFSTHPPIEERIAALREF